MYLGNQPALSYTSFAKQDFTTSATTSYTLDNPVANANELALFINFVRQEPTTAYSASGTSLTLTSATSASDDMYCVFLGKAVQTVNPPNASVGISQLTATGTKDATTFLRGDNTFASAGGTNTPAFEAYVSSNQSVSNYTSTKAQCNTENFDTDNCYDNATNYRFTPTTAGKYFLYCQIYGDVGNANDWNYTITILRKNGASIKSARIDLRNSPGREGSTFLSTVVDMNGSTDYVELWGQVYAQDNAGMLFLNTETYFGGYKIIE